jgi:hypothetical protein
MKKTSWQPALRLVWPLSSQRQWLFWFAAVLLVVGILVTSADFIHTYRDDINAVSTIAIAAFTALLGIFTISLAGSTRIAADAAKDAADAAVATDRARLYTIEGADNFIQIMNFIASYSGPIDGAHITITPAINISFKNYGKTPGTIQEVCHGLKFSREPFDFICEPIDYKEAIIEGGEGTKDITCVTDPLTAREAKDIEEGRAYLWLYGRVYYKDVFDVPHVHRFYRRFARLSTDFYGMRSYEYKDYNKST